MRPYRGEKVGCRKGEYERIVLRSVVFVGSGREAEARFPGGDKVEFSLAV